MSELYLHVKLLLPITECLFLPGAIFDYSEEETFTDYEKIQNVADNDSLGQIAAKYNTKSGNSLSPI